MHIHRTTVNLNASLLEDAQRPRKHLTRTAVLEEALRALIARDAAEALAQLGGSAPKAEAGRRRRGGVDS